MEYILPYAKCLIVSSDYVGIRAIPWQCLVQILEKQWRLRQRILSLNEESPLFGHLKLSIISIMVMNKFCASLIMFLLVFYLKLLKGKY